MADIHELNRMSDAELKEALSRCCGAERWVEQMAARRPFSSREALFEAAEDIWYNLTARDWLEAFSHHPRIGDLDSLRAKFAATREWAAGEQAGVSGAGDGVLEALAEGNRAYEERFGYIFIVCATGKTADEMLSLLKERLPNSPETEIQTAMQEQSKITRIRLEKLLS